MSKNGLRHGGGGAGGPGTGESVAWAAGLGATGGGKCVKGESRPGDQRGLVEESLSELSSR